MRIKLGLALVIALALVVGFVRAPSASAKVVFNQTFPTAVGVYNTCAGFEPVFLTGTLHQVTYVSPNSAGGLRIGDVFNFNVKGVGEVTGISYVGSGASSDNFDASTWPADRTIELTNTLISQGGIPNLVMHTLIHETYDASGKPTASTYNDWFSCGG
jgi:hypothetical protein